MVFVFALLLLPFAIHILARGPLPCFLESGKVWEVEDACCHHGDMASDIAIGCPAVLAVLAVLAVSAHCHRYGRVSVTGPEQCAGPQSRAGFKGNAGLPDAAPGPDGTFGCGAKSPEETDAFGFQVPQRI